MQEPPLLVPLLTVTSEEQTKKKMCEEKLLTIARKIDRRLAQLNRGEAIPTDQVRSQLRLRRKD